jgi:hypothetical protein
MLIAKVLDHRDEAMKHHPLDDFIPPPGWWTYVEAFLVGIGTLIAMGWTLVSLGRLLRLRPG